MPDKTESPAWLVEEWSTQLGRVMESMTGEAPSVKCEARDLAAAEIDWGQEDLLWWEQPFSLGPEALAWIGAAAASWQEIGNRVLRSAGVEDGDPASIRSTYFEIIHQALSAVASSLSGRLRREVSCTEGRTAPPPAPGGLGSYKVEIDFGEVTVPLLAAFTPALTSVSTAPQQPEAPPPVEKSAPSAPSGPGAKPSAVDLLLDVELPVSVSFGRAQLPLKDVIKLTTGSIVELNRAVTEPVEVIVNNCVIARGEVVVVEGNFGVRIKQVISRQERLRTLY